MLVCRSYYLLEAVSSFALDFIFSILQDISGLKGSKSWLVGPHITHWSYFFFLTQYASMPLDIAMLCVILHGGRHAREAH